MRIGIDAIIFQNKNISGIRRSVWEIINVWKDKYPEHEYYLFAKDNIYLPGQLPSNWHMIIANKGGIRLWNITMLPGLIREYKIDVFWGTYFSLPVGKYRAKTVVTIYDMFWYKYPKLAPGQNTRRGLQCRYACHRADKIITISKSAADDIKAAYKVIPEKVVISYCGGLPSDGKKFGGQRDIKKDWYQFLRNHKFFLYLGNIEPRKNLVTLIKGYEKFRKKKSTNIAPFLVLAGKRGWKCDDVYETAKNSPYTSDIIFTDYVTDEEHDWLFSNAEAFVFPSLYEGFGIPILEAFSYNLPVITSNISSMPEVGGSAAFYIDDIHDADALGDQMQHVLNLTMAENEVLEKERVAQLSLFSWKKNATEMMQILQEVFN